VFRQAAQLDRDSDIQPLAESYGIVSVGSVVPVNTTIAFIGDVALNEETLALYELIRDEGAEAMFLCGDMDYVNNPDMWDQQITTVLGADYPVFVSEGNHDTYKWPSYGHLLSVRYENAGITTCNGVIGITETCSYKGLLLVSVAPGSIYNGNEYFAEYLTQQLTQYDTTWKVCMWHRNQHIYQTGEKPDEVGYGVYQSCLEKGAMIFTGHEHEYSRTYLMSSLNETPVIADTNNTYQNLTLLALKPGASFVIVNGLGGRSIRNSDLTLASNPWWAKVSDGRQNAKPSALFCIFHYNSNPNLAFCYAKQIDGTIIDQFFVTS